MSKTENNRARAKLNLGDVGDFKPKAKVEKNPREVAKEAAQAEGFTARHKVDARTLRKTGRNVQFNIAVKPETKEQFWEIMQDTGYSKGEELLLAMMQSFKKQSN